MCRASSRSAIRFPILANLMMSVRQGALTLTATDMEIALVEQVAATTSRDGTATAPAATLYEIVRKLPEGAQVELDHPGGDAPLALRAGRFATSLMVLPADDFPSMTAGSLPHSFRLPAQTLRGMIDRTRFAISTEETRYYLNGIYLHAADGADGHKMLRAVATDGHRLARVEETLPAGAEAIPGVIVPRKTVAEVRKLIDETSDDIEIGLSETRIQFSLGTLKLTSKLIDGTFPEYERVIPRDNDKILRVGKKDFADAVARVAAISTERSRPVKLVARPRSADALRRESGSGHGDRRAGWRPRDLRVRRRWRSASRLATSTTSPTRSAARSSSASPMARHRPWCATPATRARSTCSCRCGSDQAAVLRLLRLDLTAFRSYDRLSWRPAARLAVISGPNGSGKTNLLEAISLLGPGRGLRQARVAEFARHRPDGPPGPWAVAARFAAPSAPGMPLEIGTGSPPEGGAPDRRVVRLAGAPASQTDLAAHVTLSWITPQMERLFGEGPSGRRRFLDRLVWALDPGHAREVAAHDAAMVRRNRLSSDGRADPAWLAGLEDGMARHAVAATAGRRALVARLNAALASGAVAPFPAARMSLLCPIAERLDQMPALAVEDWLRAALAASRAADAASGSSALGAHRADMALADPPPAARRASPPRVSRRRC